MKIFTADKIKELDQYTIEHEPVSSTGLMERAAGMLFHAIVKLFPYKSTAFFVCAGPGNNGGDALALSRMLLESGYSADVHLFMNDSLSDDCEFMRQELTQEFSSSLSIHKNEFGKPLIKPDAVVIDGLFGSGLNRPLTGNWSKLILYLNSLNNTIISIDIPSGLKSDGAHHFSETSIKAHRTFSFQFPKLSFFFAENEKFVGEWEVLDIGIHPVGIETTESPYKLVGIEDIRSIFKNRKTFSHKGTFGHLGIIAGSKGMAGASILVSKAALRAGVGLVTLHGPESNRCILQNVAPEVIYEADKHQDCVTEFYHTDRYDAIAIGPGLGTRTLTVDMMNHLLKHIRVPIILDADALNIIAAHDHLLNQVPPGSIITPHPGEFDRLCGSSTDSAIRLEKAINLASRFRLYVVLKGAFTRIVCPDGKVYINSTGNPGMATAGSGDVLTGIIGALLAQEYESEFAAVIGVYIHGLAGDLALEEQSEESLMAGDIIEKLGRAFKSLKYPDQSAIDEKTTTD